MTGELTAAVHLVLPFSAYDRDGSVTVGLRPVGDGREVGFDVLDGLPFGPEAVAGFPAVQATVAYAGAGYRASMAWIQVLTIDRFPASAPPSRWTGVDLPPALDGLGLPFYCTGTCPTFFDAPALNLSGASRLHWVADAFLVTLPLRSRSEPVVPLAGFRWGYDESDDGRPPVPHPLTACPGDAWSTHRGLLRRDFPAWRFAPHPPESAT